MARLILTEAGEDVDVGGNVTVVGTTAPGEVITVLRGTISFDPSFNTGGDTVKLPDLASAFTVRILGSTAILVGETVSVSIPIGSAGLTVAFDDANRTLRFDVATGTARLGDQVITASETGVIPVGALAQILGTDGANSIDGTSGNDVIDGLGGNDTINGLAGDDFIRGGAGDDTINGGAGEDTINGGSGNDRLIDNDGGYGVIDGGSGNDDISVNNLAITSINVSGGDGDDLIELRFGEVGVAFVNAGAGNDRVAIDSDGMEVSLLLGAGRDEVVVPAGALSPDVAGPTIIIRDFEVGVTGDKVLLADALNGYLQNYTAGSNPFASGHLKLIDFFGNAYLQVDRDGSAGPAAPTNLVNFAGINLDTLTADNFGGFDPRAAGASAQSAQFSFAIVSEPEPLASQPEPPAFVHQDLPSLQTLGLAMDHGSYYMLA